MNGGGKRMSVRWKRLSGRREKDECKMEEDD